MDNSVNLLNSASYMEQKINLQFTTEALLYNEKEIHLIPIFTIVSFPLQNAEKTSEYYFHFKIIGGFFRYNDYFLKEHSNEVTEDIIFQYDLNYSDIKGARGQIVISKKISYFNNSNNDNYWLEIKDNAKNNLLDNEYFKIIIPAQAIKKNQVNTLNYSFLGKDKKVANSIIISEYNFGAVNFYFNENPQYKLKIYPELFTNKNFILAIKNPIILETEAKKTNTSISCYYMDDFHSAILRFAVLKGKSVLDEVFEISGNNITTNNFSALKVKKYLGSESTWKDSWNYFENLELIKKIKIFHEHANLEQATNLIIDEDKFYKPNKIPAFLRKGVSGIMPYDTLFTEYSLEFTSVTYDEKIGKIVLNPEIPNNHFDIPLYEKFHFTIDIPLTFQTFFKYDIVLNFIENSNPPIIGTADSLVSLVKIAKDKPEKWVKNTSIILTYDEILKFYSSDSFTFSDYEKLNKKSVGVSNV